MCRILERVLAVTPQGYLTFSPSAKVSPKAGPRVTDLVTLNGKSVPLLFRGTPLSRRNDGTGKDGYRY